MNTKHIGASFGDFLREEGTLEETVTHAVKRARTAMKEMDSGFGWNEFAFRVEV